jgi:hypothetical protein
LYAASNSIDALLSTHGGAGAGWRPTILTHEAYLAHCAANAIYVSNLFKIKVLRLEGTMIDILHAVDQGVACHVAANVFIEVCFLSFISIQKHVLVVQFRNILVLLVPQTLVFFLNIFSQVMDTGVWGNNQAEAIEGLQEALKVWYDANKDLYKIQGKLTFARIKTSGDWPKLKAKAAATRHIMKFAEQLAELHNTNSVHDRRRLAVCNLLNRFYEILAGEERYISEASKIELRGLAVNFMEIYHLLSKEAFNARLRRWKIAHKFHMFQHLCEIQIPNFGNARWYWTYSDEDFQRIIKEIALSCHPSTVSHMVLYKWVIVFFE